jgi:hypothetical protein
VGVNVVGDCRKLERDFPHIEVRGAYDLVKMFRIAGEMGDGDEDEDGNGNGGRYSQVRSLAGLMSAALSLRLEKGAVRCGNWERVPLSADQVKYAALDAYAGMYMLYYVIRIVFYAIRIMCYVLCVMCYVLCVMCYVLNPHYLCYYLY